MTTSSSGYNDRLRELLFDSGEHNMNLTNVLRDRVEDLSNRIDSVMACLSTAESAEAKWKAGLYAYVLLHVHLQQLTETMKPLMKSYALCPVNFTPEDAAKWPELLATLLHPEQESRIQQVEDEAMVSPEEARREIDRIDERNDLISDLIRVSRKPGSGLLDPKGPTRKKRSARSAEIRYIIRQAVEKDQQSVNKRRKTKKQKRLTVTPPDPVTGCGVLTNAFLFGYGLKEDSKRR